MLSIPSITFEVEQGLSPDDIFILTMAPNSEHQSFSDAMHEALINDTNAALELECSCIEAVTCYAA